MSPRCRHCRMHHLFCICDQVPELPPLTTRVEVLMHKREWSKTTATAHLARLVLGDAHCRIHQRGHQDRPVVAEHVLDPARRPLLLFPATGARVLNADLVAEDPRPIALVVPDGSWRQAAKVPKRVEWLKDVQRVVLPDLQTRYRLREENRAGGLATYEAIAYALGAIEGDAVGAAMLRLFDAMVEGTLATRKGLG